jgi:AcrR family transcriptional regulator
MTKGALYHLFDSKDALATAIIEHGTNLTHDAFRNVCESEPSRVSCTLGVL